MEILQATQQEMNRKLLGYTPPDVLAKQRGWAVGILISLLCLAGAGAVPFGLLVGLANGIDPRKAGSGNIGATNVGRLLGKKFFFIVFTLDLLKGLLPMLGAAMIVVFSTSRKVSVAD